MSEENRRPIKARSVSVFQKLASFLAKTNISPNQISVFSVLFSLLVPFACWFFPVGSWSASLLAILGIQLRLLCNLIDGMVAIEGGKKSPVGEIYNEFPDRIADTIVFFGILLPFFGQQQALVFAWATSFFAMFTAYTRVLGASARAKHYFLGPMAKQHRMAILSLLLLVLPMLPSLDQQWRLVESTFWVICMGSAVTILRRLIRIAKELKA